MAASRGRWKPAEHLWAIDHALSEAVAGRGPDRILITMPPRHGKSELCSKYFPAWFVGAHPDKRILLASYEAEFAKSWGRKSRDLLEEFGEWFSVSVDRRSSAAAQWDLVGRYGGMGTAGVGGPITGKGADVLLVDDPVKNAEDADSEVKREKAWEWWLSTAMTRLEPGGVAIVIQTRWHEDDLAGRILANEDDPDEWLHINLPAISDDGAALWPERYSIRDLQKIRDRLAASGGARWWEALYQQRPTPKAGEMFDVGAFIPIGIYDIPAEAWRHGRLMRFWDMAATKNDGDYTAGVAILYWRKKAVAKDMDPEEFFFIIDVERGQWDVGERDKRILRATAKDAATVADYEAVCEQEGGSAGVTAARQFRRMLSGYRVSAERSTGSKPVRAGGYSSAVDAGNVYIVRAPWNAAFLEEHRSFPRGVNDDQVDAAAGAYNKLSGKRNFHLEDWLNAGAF